MNLCQEELKLIESLVRPWENEVRWKDMMGGIDVRKGDVQEVSTLLQSFTKKLYHKYMYVTLYNVIEHITSCNFCLGWPYTSNNVNVIPWRQLFIVHVNVSWMNTGVTKKNPWILINISRFERSTCTYGTRSIRQLVCFLLLNGPEKFDKNMIISPANFTNSLIHTRTRNELHSFH